MKKNWRYELARDFIGLASIPFLAITIVRVSVLEFYYPMQFVVSSLLFFLLKFIFKGDLHAGIGIILLIFTSLYYHRLLFAIFAVLIYIGIVCSLFYLGRNKKEVLKGIIFGVVSAGIGYVVAQIIYR